MNIRILSLVCACLILSSCKNDPSSPGQVEVPIFVLNSSARYSWSIVEADSLADTVVVITDTLQTNVASIDDIVGADSGLIRLEAFSIPHYIATTQVWYSQSSDSLVEVAYSAAGATPPVLPKRVERSVIGSTDQRRGNGDYIRMPLSIRWALKAQGLEDSVIERTEKRIVYRYPLFVGSTWTSFSDPFLQTREVEAYEVVTAGHQAHSCAKIRTSLPTIAPDVVWYDYVAPEGLVKRIIYFPSILITSEGNPDGGNGRMVTVTESLTLMD